MQDKNITCAFVSCGETFIHSVKDQEFYERMKFPDPKYCKTCRERRKQERAQKEFQEATEKGHKDSSFQDILDKHKDKLN